MTPTVSSFYSHIASAKGRELAANPKAALLFHWKSLRRQVRIRGNVTPVTDAEADAYFATGRSRRRSAPGPASSRSRWKAASPSSRRSRWSPPSISSARCRARPAGAAGALRPCASSSGTTVRSACTTASNSAATGRAQPWSKVRLIYPLYRRPETSGPENPDWVPALSGHDKKSAESANAPRRTLLLTGASRGIGHATVIRFSSAGWRVITCSRHAFPEDCPWDAGPEDHIEVDLGDHDDTTRAISEIRSRLEDGELHALVNNAAISPKGAGGGAAGHHGHRHRDLEPCVSRQLLRADHDGARPDRGIEGGQRLGGERHLDRGLRACIRSQAWPMRRRRQRWRR